MNKDAKNKSSKRKADENQTHPRISTRHLWLFRIITVVVAPVLLLILLEIFLRIIGYGFPASTFVKC